MCRHTRKPTVLSRVSCRPSHLNFDRFHQPCLFSSAHSRGRCGLSSPVHVAATYPCGQPCVSLEVFATPTGRYHGRTSIRPSLLHVPPSRKGVCTHAGSGPSRVRRRLSEPCLRAILPGQLFFGYRIGTRADANIHKTFACRYLSNYFCTVVEEWHHGYFCLGYFTHRPLNTVGSEGVAAVCSGFCAQSWVLVTETGIFLSTGNRYLCLFQRRLIPFDCS